MTISHLKLARYPELLTGPIRPMHWDVDPSSVCDHRCRGCPYIFEGAGAGETDPMLGVIRLEMAKDKRGFLDFDHFGRFLFEAKMLGCKAITFVGGGEPTLHPKFTEMMQITHAAGVKFGVVSHFGGQYDRSLLAAMAHATWVRVSLNAGTRETYLKHQGRDHFDRVLDNIAQYRRATEYAGTYLRRNLGASFLITNDNWFEIELAASVLYDAGAQYIQYKPIIEVALGKAYEGFETQIGEALAFTRSQWDEHGFDVIDQWTSRLDELKRHERGEFSGPCHIVRWNPKLGANGIVYQCCELAYNDEAALGNIYEEPLAAILEDADNKLKEMRGCAHCWIKPVNAAINEGAFGEIKPPPESADQEFL